MNKIIQNQITILNGIYKEMDMVYHEFAHYFNISDNAFWILYILKEEENIDTQKSICDFCCTSKQTVNSALKKLEALGYILLEYKEGSHKEKHIVLTHDGELLAQNIIDKVDKAENEAFSQLTDDERNAFITLYRKYIKELRLSTNKVLKATLEDN